MHEAAEACVVTGANLGQPMGIVMLNAEAAASLTDPAKRDELSKSLERHLRQINATLDPHEQLDCLVVVTETWSVANDLITPSFKVKRNRIDEFYGANYERWVASNKAVVWHLAGVSVDGR